MLSEAVWRHATLSGVLTSRVQRFPRSGRRARGGSSAVWVKDVHPPQSASLHFCLGVVCNPKVQAGRTIHYLGAPWCDTDIQPQLVIEGFGKYRKSKPYFHQSAVRIARCALYFRESCAVRVCPPKSCSRHSPVHMLLAARGCASFNRAPATVLRAC